MHVGAGSWAGLRGRGGCPARSMRAHPGARADLPDAAPARAAHPQNLPLPGGPRHDQRTILRHRARMAPSSAVLTPPRPRDRAGDQGDPRHDRPGSEGGQGAGEAWARVVGCEADASAVDRWPRGRRKPRSWGAALVALKVSGHGEHGPIKLHRRGLWRCPLTRAVAVQPVPPVTSFVGLTCGRPDAGAHRSRAAPRW